LRIVELEEITSVLSVWLDHNWIRFSIKEGADSMLDRIGVALGTRPLRCNSFESWRSDECHQ
jgi:hypothetical protein